jgi:hypothetical protein
VLTVNLPLLTIPLRGDQILISKILVGRKTSEVVENADESSFGEGQVALMTYFFYGEGLKIKFQMSGQMAFSLAS